MAEIRMREDFDVSAEALWALLADFGDLRWAPGSPRAQLQGQGLGAVRSVLGPDGPIMSERLEALDPATRTLGYSIVEGVVLPVDDYRATMVVHELEAGRSRLEWSSQWQPRGVSEEQARGTLEGVYAAMLAGLHRVLEESS